MPEPIVMVDTSAINEGLADSVAATFEELTAFVATEEPRVGSYGVYFDQARTHVTVVQVHPDSASLTSHMELAAHIFRKFAGSLVLRRIDVYGMPDPPLLERLREKAELLGGATIAVHEPVATCVRLAAT